MRHEKESATTTPAYGHGGAGRTWRDDGLGHITYTTSTKPALKLNKTSFVGTALTMLASNAAGAALTLETDSPDGSSTPLALEVQDPSQAPMSVDSQTKVANLNADNLDGKDSSDFASAYQRTVVVSPVGTDAQNGQALLDALSGITDASASKPYLLYIEPGTYDLGNNGTLSMKEWVDIQGSGELNTVITSGVVHQEIGGPGTVNGANNAEMRFLTVRNTGKEFGINTAISNNSVSPRLTHVTAEAIGASGTTNIGVVSVNSSPTMTDVTATASGGKGSNFNIGVFSDSSSLTIEQSKLSGSGGFVPAALRIEGGSTAKVALTQLVGMVSTDQSTLQCFNNYNGNMAAVTCP